MYVVYGRNGCPFCDKATDLLDSLNLEYEYRNISDGPGVLLELLDLHPEAKTVPQIFLDQELIGGFTELSARLNQKG